MFKKKYVVDCVDYKDNEEGKRFVLGDYPTMREALHASSVYIKQDLENRRAIAREKKLLDLL